MDKPRCPSCDSVDTVGYWDKADTSTLAVVFLSAAYPNARKCIDCDFVWWPEMLKPHPSLAFIRKEEK